MATNNSKPLMRLVNGHYKMAPKSLKKMFLMQLNSVYCVKQYLLTNLPQMAEEASFPDLEQAIHDNLKMVKMQIMRLDDIYALTGEEYSINKCVGIKVLSLEAFVNSIAPGMTGIETDLYILIYLNTMESIEISGYQVLKSIAKSLRLSDVSELLEQNIAMAQDTKDIYKIISAEYLV